MFLYQVRWVVAGCEGCYEVVGVLVQGFRTGADSFATKTQAVREGSFDVERMAAVKMKVLLLVGWFDVDGCVKVAIGQMEVDIEESSMGLGVGPGEADGTKGVEVGKENQEFFFTVSPDHEDVVNEPVPNIGRTGLGIQEGLL